MNSQPNYSRRERFVRGRVGWLALAVAQFIVVNLVNFKVLRANLSAEVYPIDADSIGIPLMSSVLIGAVTTAFCGAAVLMPVAWRIARFALVGIAGAVTALQTLAWADVDHWPMSVSYFISTIVLMWIAIRIFRDPLSRNGVPHESH